MPQQRKGGRRSKARGGTPGAALRRGASKSSRRDPSWWERPLTVAAALIAVGTFAYQFIDRGDSPVLALTPSAPHDQGTHIECNGHGRITPPTQKPEVVVSVACQELVDGEWEDIPEVPPAESCEKCVELTAQHTVSCDGLGDGAHEIRTQTHGFFEDEDGHHEPDPVESEQTIVVDC